MVTSTTTTTVDRQGEYRAICLGRWNGRTLQNPKEEKKAEAEGSDESSLMMMKTMMMKTTLMMMTMQDNADKDNDEKDNSAKHNDDSDDVVDDKMDLESNSHPSAAANL